MIFEKITLISAFRSFCLSLPPSRFAGTWFSLHVQHIKSKNVKFDLRFCLWILGRTWSALTAMCLNYTYIHFDQATGGNVESHYGCSREENPDMLHLKLNFKTECTDFKPDWIWCMVHEGLVWKCTNCQQNSWIVYYIFFQKTSWSIAVYCHCRHWIKM